MADNTSLSKKKMTRKAKPIKPVPPDAFENEQLNLFQNLLANSEEERNQLSNSVDLWDSIPRYSISRRKMNEIREDSGSLPVQTLTFFHRGTQYKAQIHPAQIEIRDTEKTDQKIK